MMKKPVSVTLVSSVLMAGLCVSLLFGLFMYRQSDSLMAQAQPQLQLQLASLFASNRDPTEQTRQAVSTLPLSWLEVRNRQNGQWLAASEGQAATPVLTWLFPDHFRALSLATDRYIVNYQANYALYLEWLWHGLALLYALLLLSGLGILGLYRAQLRRLEGALLLQIRQEETTEGPLPRVSAALAGLLQDVNLRLEEALRQNRELEHKVYQDSLTGLANRLTFRRELTELLHTQEHSLQACLILIRATELGHINQQRGYLFGDGYLQAVASMLLSLCRRLPRAQAYRLAGGDFAILVRQASEITPALLGRELKQLFDSYGLQQDLESVAYTGLTLLRPGQQPEQVLARADLALAKAQTSAINGWILQEGDGEDFLQGEHHWQQVITEVMEHQGISLLHQPIQPLKLGVRSYNEIFARFTGPNQQLLPTETLLAMAQRHGLLLRLEQQIIETIIRQHATQPSPLPRWGINLSIVALLNTAFLVWLERLLLRDANIAANLVFELDEDLLDANLAASKRLFEMLRRVGSRSCIAKFGKGLGSFRLQRELKPDYIKLDQSLIGILERDSAGQQFIRMIVEVSHRLGCTVIAEGVEQLTQKLLLENMYVDAIQGYLVAKPTPLPTDRTP